MKDLLQLALILFATALGLGLAVGLVATVMALLFKVF